MKNDFFTFVKTYFPDVKLTPFQEHLVREAMKRDCVVMMRPPRPVGFKTVRNLLIEYYKHNHKLPR